MSVSGKEALAAAVKALPSSPRKALQVFGIAIDNDPDMADAWLGRVAAGDRSLETLGALSTHSRNLGVHLRSLGKSPKELGAYVEVEAVVLDIVDSVSAQAAYAVGLIDARQYAQADAHLAGLPDRPEVAYIRAVLHWRTKRWPDMLTALKGCDQWMNSLLLRAGSLLEALAAANLGLMDRAAAAAARADTVPGPGGADRIHRDAQFCLALVARARGEEEQARTLLTEIRVNWPDFDMARTALEDPTYGFQVTDEAVINTRTDRWDSTTQRTQEMEQAERQAALLASAEATLTKQIGLVEVKEQVHKLRSHVKVNKVRVERGFEPIMRSHHLIFSGPPGTGKTTIARVVADVYCGLGVLKSSKFREASGRADFVGKTLGSTAIKTNNLIDSALDGVLFVDEAYTLIQKGLQGGDAFGREALDTLLARMENDRARLVVIIAGYDDEIDRFLGANEGLVGRFPRRIRFPSYGPSELARIGQAIAADKDSSILPAGARLLEGVCAKLAVLDAVVGAEDGVIRKIVAREDHYGQLGAQEKRRPLLDVLGNGRFIRNVVEASFGEQMHRLADEVDTLDESVIDTAITTLQEHDVILALKSVLTTVVPEDMNAASLIDAARTV